MEKHNLLKALFKRNIPCRLCLCATSEDLCDDCLAELPFLNKALNYCSQCALPLLNEHDGYCGECLKRPPDFDCCLSPFTYQAPISDWIRRFKDQGDLREGKLLARLLTEHIRHELADSPECCPDGLIPVPLHWRNQLLRGFNQSAWLCLHLSRALSIDTLSAIKRHRYSGDQRKLNRHQRQVNLRQSMTINPRQRHDIQGKHLAVVDDVVTTTATARAISKLLLKAGARRVDVWCLARTPKR